MEAKVLGAGGTLVADWVARRALVQMSVGIFDCASDFDMLPLSNPPLVSNLEPKLISSSFFSSNSFSFNFDSGSRKDF